MRALSSFLLILTLIPFASHARSISDVKLEEIIKVDASDAELSLNGAALRKTYMVINTYVGGLYLENPSHDENQILESDEHRRMLFHVLLRKVTARKIAQALKDALVLNISVEEQKELEPNINQFIAMFEGKLKRGDEVNIDYIPGKGTHVIIGGTDKGIVPGKQFADALLSVWVGENPVGSGFKQDILGY
ncbi:chalcone isomerase family protein [Alkalimarinus alittae]|uniref:Chalcone isomerase family protein n=1 Tax=Alkalimarinus alittae TaxID=2961619 RepID=A0ABY6N664_9ALTE|nr:chalcone isomerase family protein [Alkalimarinus alittae]UZE97608.1 chalcone isomerase family protein [Alkalimarinus alittae]